jgi:hypothetical protein
MSDSSLFIIGLSLFILLLGLAVFFIARIVRAGKLKRSLTRKLLLIRLPRRAQAQDRPDAFKQEINQFEQLLGIIAQLEEHTTFEAAVHHTGEEIHFYVALQEKQVPFISRQIEGLFKDARVEETAEYNIFQPNGFSIGFYLKQHEHFALPVRTYTETESDTFSPIINTLSKLQAVGEGAALQILIRNADKQYKKNIHSILNNLKKGGGFDMSASQKIFDLKQAREDLRGGEERVEEKEKVLDENRIRQLEKKLAKPLLEVNIRGLVSARSQAQAENLFETVAASLSHFETPGHNKIDTVKSRNMQKIAYQFTFREFSDDQRMVLNSEEVASMFHLPSSSTLAPNIKWLKAKDAPPPLNLSGEGTYLGESIYRGTSRPVRISDEDRRRHIYIIGQTGTGKSALMSNMIIEDMKRGKGVCIIDPHGELVESVLGCVPPEREKDVVIFDPGNLEKPIGLNMIEYDPARPEEKTFIVNEIQGIFNKLFLAETMGPMFEQYMRNALLLLMEDAAREPATLIEVPRLFTDDAYRQRKLANITNPVVLDFWQKEAAKVTGEASLTSMAPYITSKFNNFIANDYVRPIIGQAKSSFNFRKVMDEQKILLVSLAKGKIGELNAGFLGMIIVGKLLLAAFSRADIAQEQRKDFNLYIDEFQNFTTDSISTILSEARKYRLNLTIAHQFITQLEEKIRDSVFGNVGSMIAFRVGAQDTEFLLKQFEPVFSQNDLMNIDNFNAYLRLLIKGQTSQPFNVKTPFYQKSDPILAQRMKELSVAAYGTPRAQVEAGILARLRS